MESTSSSRGNVFMVVVVVVVVLVVGKRGNPVILSPLKKLPGFIAESAVVY